MSRNYYRGFEIHRLPAQMVIPPNDMLPLDDDVTATALCAPQTSQWNAVNWEATNTASTDVESRDIADEIPVVTQATQEDNRSDSVDSSAIHTLDGTTTPLAAPRHALPLHLIPRSNHGIPGTRTSHRSGTPQPPFNLSPLCAPTHAFATNTLIDPNYYYTMVRQHSLRDTPRPYFSELFARRNHAVILDIEQMLADFHIQLKGCHVWADDAALRDLWMRLKQAGRGLNALEQPQGKPRERVRRDWEGEESIDDTDGETSGDNIGNSAGDSSVEA